ncbi:Folylpolyglutamate synthase [Hondaea fermentalgiana]|uniref:Folylpolyglutamate synthase n=1 Tax=Hondaea fermentalgiana TaxID=2315210 RepID=A0A2R5GLY8_9STRA|nr:Folylpolyglutamate synthase [Hondaea fermentalgiana]|eukprot:GBG28884.1 Folylpolyglutamate synthase [Hondaea fermentalgiana]
MRRARALAGLLRGRESGAWRGQSTQAGIPFLSEGIPRRIDTYAGVLEEIYTVNERMHVKQGLQNIRDLNAAIGDPAGALNVVHVAGTNGKGSVCWKLAEALRATGSRTGLFVSPHVSSFRERVRIDGELISEEDVVKHLSFIIERAEAANIHATFFEYVTALAMHYFASNGTDMVVLETGLGGRLDSTNIINAPALTVVTNIGLEHTRVLGDTLEAIAFEKASIAKPHRPMLVGPNVPLGPVEEICSSRQAPLHVLAPQPLDGDYDVENVAMARAALEILGRDTSTDAVARALRQRPPCRFEIIPHRPGSVYVLDAGHNAPALKKLFSSLDSRIPELHAAVGAAPHENVRIQLVLALSSDKDLEGCGEAIAAATGHFSDIICTQAATSRAQSSQTIQANIGAALSQVGVDASSMVSAAGSVEEALVLADHKAAASGQPSVTIVCGTIFMMTEVRHHLGMDFPVDPLAHKAI